MLPPPQKKKKSSVPFVTILVGCRTAVVGNVSLQAAHIHTYTHTNTIQHYCYDDYLFYIEMINQYLRKLCRGTISWQTPSRWNSAWDNVIQMFPLHTFMVFLVNLVVQSSVRKKQIWWSKLLSFTAVATVPVLHSLYFHSMLTTHICMTTSLYCTNLLEVLADSSSELKHAALCPVSSADIKIQHYPKSCLQSAFWLLDHMAGRHQNTFRCKTL